MRFIAGLSITWGVFYGIMAFILTFAGDSTPAERMELRDIGLLFIVAGCILWQLIKISNIKDKLK